ncbi:hypothetical protein CIHG_09957 [Coccidioides immitis H538.4]|uniref:Uncharacterized protein n=1 Tax=Coccidioides immitis H538.4 TaxID=396776 RepID=A0A0J8S4U6_COCIT|nr:hypothetical protein CIHG_09957 [Coccidioides immitis H538.4]
MEDKEFRLRIDSRGRKTDTKGKHGTLQRFEEQWESGDSSNERKYPCGVVTWAPEAGLLHREGEGVFQLSVDGGTCVLYIDSPDPTARPRLVVVQFQPAAKQAEPQLDM